MLHTLLTFLTEFITPLGAFGVFLAEFLDGIFVFIPSTLIFLVASFIFLKGPMSIELFKTMMFVVVLPSTVGLVLGSYIFYIPSYLYGKKFIDRWGKWIGVSWDDIETFNKKFEGTHLDELSIILARVALIPSVMVTVFCGVAQVPPKKYTVVTFIGGFLKAFSVALVGWSAGELYMQYASFINKTEKISLSIIVLATVSFIYYRRRKKKMSNMSFPERV